MKTAPVPGIVLSTHTQSPNLEVRKLRPTEAKQTCPRGYNFKADCRAHDLNHCGEGNAGRAV